VSGERAHAAAWIAALDTPLGQWAAYDYDSVPATLPSIYVLITATRRFGGEPRNHGKRPMSGWRLTTLAVGRTMDEARWAREKVHTLAETRNATLGSTLLLFESENPIEADDDRYSGVTVWTYATNS
jgi:hypothetical protein